VLEVAIRIFQSLLVVYPCLKIPAFVRSPSVGVPFCQLLVPLFFYPFPLVLEAGVGEETGERWSATLVSLGFPLLRTKKMAVKA
jgi:hypothetical protein